MEFSTKRLKKLSGLLKESPETHTEQPTVKKDPNTLILAYALAVGKNMDI